MEERKAVTKEIVSVDKVANWNVQPVKIGEKGLYILQILLKTFPRGRFYSASKCVIGVPTQGLNNKEMMARQSGFYTKPSKPSQPRRILGLSVIFRAY